MGCAPSRRQQESEDLPCDEPTAAPAAAEPEAASEARGSPFRDLCNQGCTLREKYRLGKTLGESPDQMVCCDGHRLLEVREHDSARYSVRSYRKKLLDALDTEMVVEQCTNLYPRVADQSSCPNILQLVECFEDEQRFYMVMENSIPGGELFEEILYSGKFAASRAAAAMRSIVAAIKQLHEHGIVHRDIRPESFWFRDTEKTMDSLVLTCLSSAAVLSAGEKLDKRIGAPYYIAPEVLDKNYGHACDMWSAGVVAYILLTGVPPFNGPSDHEIMKIIRTAEWSWGDTATSIPEEAKDFVAKLLQADPEARPTAEEALRHPWLEQRPAEDVPKQDTVESSASIDPRQMHGLKLRKAIASLVRANRLGRADSDELGEVFRRMDGDGNGTLSLEELRSGIQESMAWAPESDLEEGEGGGVGAILREMDADGDGMIDYLEFAAAFGGLTARARESFARETFALLDKDGDGRVLRSELESALGEDIATGTANKDQTMVSSILEGLKAALGNDSEAEVGLTWEEFSSVVALAVQSNTPQPLVVP